MKGKEKGEFTIQQRKRKREIIEESHHQGNISPDVSDEEKKYMEKTGDKQHKGGKQTIFQFSQLRSEKTRVTQFLD